MQPSAFRIGQAGRNGLAAPEGPEPHPPDAGSDYPALLFQWRLRARAHRAGDVDVRHGRALGDASSRLVASTPHANRVNSPTGVGDPRLRDRRLWRYQATLSLACDRERRGLMRRTMVGKHPDALQRDAMRLFAAASLLRILQ